jgi:cadmium resistance protein CadD (predicted permease)
MWKQSYFWFSNPPSYLLSEDKIIIWVFAGMMALGIIFKIFQVASKHQANGRLWRRLSNPFIWIGILGGLWFLLRFELVPIFSQRWWPASLVLIFLIWFSLGIKYLFSGYRWEKKEIDRELERQRYLSDSKN